MILNLLFVKKVIMHGEGGYAHGADRYNSDVDVALLVPTIEVDGQILEFTNLEELQLPTKCTMA